MLYSISKFDIGKYFTTPTYTRTRRNIQKQRASSVPTHLKDTVNRLLDILEQNKTILSVNKEQQLKGSLSTQ